MSDIEKLDDATRALRLATDLLTVIEIGLRGKNFDALADLYGSDEDIEAIAEDGRPELVEADENIDNILTRASQLRDDIANWRIGLAAKLALPLPAELPGLEGNLRLDGLTPDGIFERAEPLALL